MEDNGKLHVVMVPWVAMGHLLPFLELSKRLARKGHTISFVSTPRNIQRLLDKIPLSLAPSINLVEFPLPHDGNLPDAVEATVDLPSEDLRPHLSAAYDSAFQRELSTLLRRSPADWVLYDTSAYWAPRIAAENGIPSVFLGLFNAVALCFFGGPSDLRGEGKNRRTTMEQLTKPPEWVPFPSTVAYRPHEIRDLMKHSTRVPGVPMGHRFARAIEECRFVAVRSCVELEPEWLRLLEDLYQKPVIPLGLFPPSAIEVSQEEESCREWSETYTWLDKQQPGSVVYVAFGSEVILTSSQAHQIANGLELSGLPFVWASRPDTSLPEGFEDRIRGRGVVSKGWVPQVGFLSHPSVGGFLTHGGWNSIVEGLSAGAAMVVLPLLFDQGLNARHLVAKGFAVEVERDKEDGSFTGKGIAEKLRLAMVEDEGESLREKAKGCKETFGDDERNDAYVEEFVENLWKYRKQGPKAV